ncbi:hypothetical protein K3495_g10514 [Podosphaera aphanis]|nr:hypothetical protein K3495_g10514 [Podosphaera aphanis]
MANHEDLSLPNFDRAGSYNGSIPASRWLLWLKYDFQRAGHNPQPGELYLEAIEMLVDGPVADRLAGTPRIRRIINTRESATSEQIAEVNEWLKEEFADNYDDHREQDVQSEIQNFTQKTNDDQNTQKPETLLSRPDGKYIHLVLEWNWGYKGSRDILGLCKAFGGQEFIVSFRSYWKNKNDHIKQQSNAVIVITPRKHTDIFHPITKELSISSAEPIPATVLAKARPYQG